MDEQNDEDDVRIVNGIPITRESIEKRTLTERKPPRGIITAYRNHRRFIHELAAIGGAISFIVLVVSYVFGFLG